MWVCSTRLLLHVSLFVRRFFFEFVHLANCYFFCSVSFEDAGQNDLIMHFSYHSSCIMHFKVTIGFSPLFQVKKANPKELNPYLKDNGSGYPEDSDGNATQNQLFSSSLVGDGGASWRLKALKRAQEQAAREGRDFEEVCVWLM